MTQLQAAVDRDAGDVGAWRSLAAVAVQRAAQVGDPAFYGIADRALERAEALEPEAAETAIGFGVLALARHEFATALEHGRAALAELPNNSDALAVVVDAEIELGQYDDAATHVEAMLDRRPGVAALSRVSYLRELNGDVDGATAAMRAAATAATNPPDQATIAALRGDLSMLRGDLDAADTLYGEASRLAPDLVTAGVGAARVRAATGDPDGAVADLEALVDRHPVPAAVALLADLQQLLGRDTAAADNRELARALTDLQSRNGQVVDLELAVFEADRGDDPQRAIALARDAHDARPNNVYAADALAWALARAGQIDRARPLVDDALRLGSVDPALRFRAAWVLAQAGEPAAARDHLRHVAESSPWSVIGYRDEAATLADDLEVAVPAAWR